MTLSKTTAEASPRASTWEWMQMALLVINLVWTTLCLGGFLATTMVTTSALTGALLGIHFLERAVQSDLPRLHVAGWLLLPFLVYGAVNVQWISPVPWMGWMDWWNWMNAAAVFWVVLNGVRSTRPRLAVFFALVGLGVLLVLLACYQRFVASEWLILGRTQAEQFIGRASGSFGSPNSLAAFLLLFLPVLAALTLRRDASATQRVIWGYLTLLFALALGLTISRGAWLSLGLVAALCPFLVRGSAGRRLAYVAGCWACLLAVTFVTYRTLPGVRERFDLLQRQGGELSRPIMWRAAWNIFREQPLTGGGAGSYNVRFDQHRPERFQLEARTAHNQYLDTLSDYGAIGAVLLIGASTVIGLGCLARRRRAHTNGLDGSSFRTGLALGLLAFALQLVVDSTLQLPALAMSFATVSGMWVQRSWPVIPSTSSPTGTMVARVVSGLVAIGIVATTIGVAGPMYRGEGIRAQARENIDRMAPGRFELDPEVLVGARDGLTEATRIAPGNGSAWSDLSYATAAMAQMDSRIDGERRLELAREAETAARRALAISTGVAEFWIRRGVALDLQGRWVEAGSALVQALELAPTRAGVWYQQAVHLSLNRGSSEQALAAAGFSLRLDPGNPEAHALRQQLAERSHAR